MRFKRAMRLEAGLQQIDIAPLIDIVFQLLIFFMLTSSFVVNPGINIKLPKAGSSEEVKTSTLTITVSSEDIIYINGKPLTAKELEGFVKKDKYVSAFIKADRDSSLGGVVKVWDICKKYGIDKIGIATTYGNK